MEWISIRAYCQKAGITPGEFTYRFYEGKIKTRWVGQNFEALWKGK